MQNLLNKNGFFLIICLFFSVLLFVSCGGEQAEEPTQETPPQLQEEVERLQTEVTEKEETIGQLQQENSELRIQIPESYEVQEGDSHWQIAYDYLTKTQGLPPEEANRLMADTPLFHPILVGFKIWNHFYKGVYGTYLTQGSARLSPGKLARLEKKKIKEKRLTLEQQLAQLQNQKQELIQKMEELSQEHQDMKKQLNEQIFSLQQELENMENQNQDLDSRVNSVYYMAGSKDELKASGKIKGSFLGLAGVNFKEVSYEDFANRADLRKTDAIEIRAQDMNMSRIKKVGLLPKHLDEGEDYRIEISSSGESATVHLLDKGVFRLARIIIFLN
jgi:hypothetical protein